jgi:hypothetical protein
MISHARRQSRRRKRRSGSRDAEAGGINASGEPVALGIRARKRHQNWVDLNQGDGKLVDAASHSEPGRTDAGAKIDEALARPRRAGGGEQDRVVADAVALARLPQYEPTA